MRMKAYLEKLQSMKLEEMKRKVVSKIQKEKKKPYDMKTRKMDI